MGNLVLEPETFAVRGACFEVYREKGCGFLEPVYQECMAIELGLRGIPFRAQVRLPLEYKGRPLSQHYVPDFVCYESVIVELKATSELVAEHRAQVLNYLTATRFRVGLLVNFGHYPGVEIERLAL
jgi:GxxExxY protein